MQFQKYFVLLAICLLIGCASTNKQASTTEDIDYNAEFNHLISKFKQSSESVTYDQLWYVYLKSNQIDNSGGKQYEYMQLVNKLENNELSCADINWDEVTLQNFWSIKPHISAQTCYESLGNTTQASFHASVIEFILSGILSQGDGKNYYSAYEIATWGDASDVIEFSGYEIVDSYLELKHHGQALYYIYVVNDPETGEQKEIYFENNKFLHEILDIQYPFAALSGQLKTEIVDFFSKTDTHAKIAKAKTLISEGKFDEAVNMYLNATNDGSAVANFLLGILCHSEKQTILSRNECSSYLFQAAELGYMNATIALAFVYKEGIEVEKNESLFIELMASVEEHFKQGEAWYKFANFYNNILGIKDDAKYQAYLNKAASLGNQKAEYASIMIDLKRSDDNNKKQVEEILVRLEALAKKGLDTAQITYANILIKTSSKGSDKWNEAKLWIDKSAAQNNPFAQYLKGNAYKYGYFGEENLLKAYYAYNEAALGYYPDAQLNVGYFNDIGQVVESNKRLAMSWYFLCAKANNLVCIRNIGIFFRDGIVVEQNYEIALNNFKYASNLGHTQSTISLGYMYLNGNGVEQNPSKAYELFKTSCDAKDGEACRHLGYSYREGKGLAIDLKKANVLFEKSCNFGDTEGCFELALVYEKGNGFEKNYPRAIELYEKGCNLGEAKSCTNLGYIYEHGQGLTRDKKKAKGLYMKGCKNGNQIGCSNYRNLQ